MTCVGQGERLNPRCRFAPTIVITFLGFLFVAPLRAQEEFASDATRLTSALKIASGQTVADIGAGEGQLSVALSRIVGSSGRVYATDVSADRLHDIRKAADAAGAKNISIVEGHATRTNLPDACCDAIVVRFVYHHFREPHLMNRSLRQALKPGGLLAVIDFPPDSAESRDPAGRTSGNRHGVTAATVIRELGDAGFELVRSEDGAANSGFMVVARRLNDR
jgi:ubiquinone/menaquinone biosynthesis C-methylase UbiE